MARLTFPTATVAAYKGQIGVIRRLLQEWASYLKKSPAAATDVAGQVSAFVNQAGLVYTPAPTQLLVTSGVEFLGPAIGGAYVNGYTLTIVGGVVTAIVAS